MQEVKVGAERQLPFLSCSCHLVTQTLRLLLFTPLLAESEAFESGLLVYPIKRGFSRNIGKGRFSVCGSAYAVVYHCMYVFTHTTGKRRK